MNSSKLVREADSVRQILLTLLTDCIISKGEFIGAGQFILQDGKSEHVGIYGTSAIVETMALCQSDWLKENITEFLRVFEKLVYVNPEGHDARDQALTFKLCAVLNALRSVQFTDSNETIAPLREKVQQSLLLLVYTDKATGTTYWPYAKSETDAESTAYVLPTAYAVYTLASLGVTQDPIPGATRFLVQQLYDHLSGNRELHIHELVHILLALISIREPDRHQYVKREDIARAEYFLYQHIIRNQYFEATYVNFTITKPEFESLFYVVKANLTILKYFLQVESPYLRTTDVRSQIRRLLQLIRSQGRFVDRANSRSAVRENSLALRVVSLVVDKYESSRVPPVNRFYSYYCKYIKWQPTNRLVVTIIRFAVLFGICAIPFLSYFWSDGSKSAFVSVCSSILAAVVYEHLRRPR